MSKENEWLASKQSNSYASIYMKIVNQFTFQCCIVQWIQINQH